MTRQVRSVLSSLGLLLAPGGCGASHGISFLAPYGVIASAQRTWFFEILALVAIVVLPTFVLIPGFAWHFRRRNNAATYKPDWSFYWPLEIAVWGIPCIIVAVLTWIIITEETKADPFTPIPSKTAALQVQVIALNWKWLFIYPDQHIATVGQLVIPQGQPVSFRLTSDATMQSFFIPALGSQIYAMAGMVTQLNLRADKPGTLLGENTQFNGTGFSGDKFAVQVVSPAAFVAWVASAGRNGQTLDEPAYETLLHNESVTIDGADFKLPPSPARSFASVQPGLFEMIVAKYRTGGVYPHLPGQP